MPKVKYVINVGDRFGKLTAIQQTEIKKWHRYAWLFKCDCGVDVISVPSVVCRGDVNTKSCGCGRIATLKRIMFKHGHTLGKTTSPTYNSWRGMLDRCTSESHKDFIYYGARGIKVCERWLKFENFFADMGERPKGRTIDRIDGNGQYELANCRWATSLEQRHNTRKYGSIRKNRTKT
jgi:hypothetical protein